MACKVLAGAFSYGGLPAPCPCLEVLYQSGAAGGPDPHPREASDQADLHHRSAMLFSTAPRMKWLLSSYLVPALLTLPGLASAGTSLGEPFRVHSAQTT